MWPQHRLQTNKREPKHYSNFYVCPICRQHYLLQKTHADVVGRVPIILNCSHTVCSDCVRKCVTSGEIMCNDCGTATPLQFTGAWHNIIEVMPINYCLVGKIYCDRNDNTASNIKMKFETCGDVSNLNLKNNFEKCSWVNCNKLAELRCEECVDVYCRACCDSLHKNVRALMSHNITSSSLPLIVKSRRRQCPKHVHDPIKFLCMDCDEEVCSYCLLESHMGHRYASVEELSTKQKEEFPVMIAQAEDVLKMFQCTAQKIDNRVKSIASHAFIATHKNAFTALHAKLLAFEQQLRNEFAAGEGEKRTHLFGLKSTVAAYVEQLKRLIERAKGCDLYDEGDGKSKDLHEIYVGLRDAVNLPCYLVVSGEENDLSKVVDRINGLDACLRFRPSDDVYRLCPRHALPESYNFESDSSLNDDDNNDQCGGTTYSVQHNHKRVKMSTPRTSKSSITPTSSDADRAKKRVSESGSLVSLKTDAKERVTVTHIASPDCFYVQLARNEDKLDELNKAISNYLLEQPPIVENPVENEVYLVEYRVNNTKQWCRGRIRERVCQFGKDAQYNVMFLDYGNSQDVSQDSVRKICPRLLHTPSLAFNCRLFNLYPIGETWDEKVVKHMAKIINNDITILQVMNKVLSTYEVDLLCISDCGDTSLRDALIFIGLALPHNEPNSSERAASWNSQTEQTKLFEKCYDFKEDDELDVVVTYTLDPYKVFVQEYSYQSAMVKLHESMTKFYKGHTNNKYAVFSPKVGMIVAVTTFLNYQGDSSFFRGRVKEVFDGQASVKVYLVDVGLEMKVPWTSLRGLEAKFRTVQVQTFPVKLADIKPKGETWTPLGIEYLKNMELQKSKLRMVVKRVTDPLEVVLLDQHPSFDMCINAALVEEGHAESTGESSTVVNVPKVIKSKIAKPNPKPDTVTMDLMNVFSLKYVEPMTKESIEIGNSGYKEVTVLNTESPDLIYVSFIHPKMTSLYQDLQRNLQLFYVSQPQPNCKTDLQENSKCIVYDKNRKYLLRAIVEKADADEYEVFLYDFAERLKVPKTGVWQMDENIMAYPNFATRCHLSNLKPAGSAEKWSLSAIDCLKDIFQAHDRILLQKDGAIDVNSQSLPVKIVYLQYVEGSALEKSKYNYIEINSLLVSNGVAFKLKQTERPSETETKNDAQCDDPDVTMVDVSAASNSLPNHANWNDLIDVDESRSTVEIKETSWPKPFDFTQRKFEAIATFVDHDGGIYLHDVKLQPVIERMETELRSMFEYMPPEPEDTVWNVGDLCTVRYVVNKNWYRGKVTRVNSDRTLHVVMVDYGNDEECKYEDVRKNVVFANVPLVANKVYLHGAYQSEWTTFDLDVLHSLVVEKNVTVHIKSNFNMENQTAVIHLDDRNVIDLLAEQTFLNRAGDVMSGVEEDDDADVVIEAEDMATIPLNSSIESMHLSTSYTYVPLPQTNTFDISVINVVKFNEVIVQVLTDKKDDKRFEEMSKEINDTGYTMATLDELYVDQACIALFNEDGHWYRAEIVRLNDDETVVVRFVDFGNFDRVPFKNLRCLQPKWLQIPVEQYIAKLSNIELVYITCKDEVFAHLETLYNAVKTANVLSRQPLCIDIYERGTDTLSYQSLIEKNLIRMKH